jgi:cellulose synthase/poly-beta-1,6-N-acetylglucosamine synthase-like glycosyltransferase
MSLLWELPGALADIALWGGLVVLLVGLTKLAFVPLAIAYEGREALRRRNGHRSVYDDRPAVSVIVPAYNEATVLANCVRSLLASDYPRLDIVIVDDGSTDDTATVMRTLAAEDSRIRTIFQANAGKGAALNRGIAYATGEVLMFVDADGIFAPTTISEMLRGFDHPDVGAVCGDDRPVNLNRPQTHLLALVNHVGTGLVRRALTLLRCLPIVSGNIGAFRRSAVAEVGGFREDTVGEDLELTWRVHKHGYRVNFRPTALVHAEVPSTMRGLWKQRVRWGRGLLQTLRIHARMVGNPRYRSFGLYLIYNTLTMVVLPVLQLVVLALLPFAVATHHSPVSANLWAIAGWLGIGLSLLFVIVAVVLGRSWRDLRFAWSVVLWPAYSIGMAAVMAAAIVLEFRGGPASWNKLERSGVVTAAASRHDAGLA